MWPKADGPGRALCPHSAGQGRPRGLGRFLKGFWPKEEKILPDVGGLVIISLTLADFTRVLSAPRAVVIGAVLEVSV